MESKNNIAKLMKNAILFGMGMAIDLAGNAAFVGPPLPPQTDMMSHDFEKVGEYLHFAFKAESPKIERAIAILKEEQIQLKV